MKITENLKKPYWTRRVTPDSTRIFPPAGDNSGYANPKMPEYGTGYINMTSADFLNEVCPLAHQINSKYMSRRPVYGPTGKKDKDGKEEWGVVAYDEIETTPFAIQHMLISKKVAHLTGRKFWISCESEDEEAFNILRSWFDAAGIWDAYKEWVWYTERCGDAALYVYQDGEKNISYKVFAFEKGDELYPGIDEKGRSMLYRKYSLQGKTAVDIFRADYIETWVMMDEESEEDKKWYEKIIGWLKGGGLSGDVSEDGFQRILHKSAQAGDDVLQVVYARIPDIVTGPVQGTICSYEKAFTYIGEENKASAFPILFVKSQSVASLPPSDLAGKVLGIRGASDTIQHADAKWLQPADASNIATLYVDKLWDNILRGTMSAFVEPADLRSGVDNSISIRILFAPDIEWAMNRWIFYAEPVRLLVRIMKRLVGKVEGDIERYGELLVSSGQNIYLPQNDAEELKMQLDMLYARAKSRKAVLEDIQDSHRNDYAQIMKEWREELEMTAEIPAKVKAEYGTSSSGEEGEENGKNNPTKPGVDNKMSGKKNMQK